MDKILIVYASKTGTTQDAAGVLAKHLSRPCDLYNCGSRRLKKEDDIEEKINSDDLNWEDYTLIVIGTAMYMGRPLKEIRLFCEKFKEKLKDKKLVVYTCGIGTEEEDKAYLWRHLPKEIREKEILYRHMGGEIREDRMNSFSRLAMREYVKQHGPATGLNCDIMKQFCSNIEKHLTKEEKELYQ